jgi:hypothetical protein
MARDVGHATGEAGHWYGYFNGISGPGGFIYLNIRFNMILIWAVTDKILVVIDKKGWGRPTLFHIR